MQVYTSFVSPTLKHSRILPDPISFIFCPFLFSPVAQKWQKQELGWWKSEASTGNGLRVRACALKARARLNEGQLVSQLVGVNVSD